jgi:hypothetical protein
VTIAIAWIDPYPRHPADAALKAATAAMATHARDVTKTKHLILVDYDRPVFAHRLWLIDRDSGAIVLCSRVSHAFLSGPIMAVRFTNEPDTHTSCRGAFVTRNSYHGKFGYAMRVEGLEPGINDNALARAIVFHTHWFIFWSGGCFVTPAAINQRLIDTAQGGTFVYVHRSRD